MKELKNKTIIAITGPSGAGKTTLGNYIIDRHSYKIPKHCTTRTPRSDDQEGFYRYLTHEHYNQLLEDNKFLLSSGDGPIVSKEYGNFYGILKEDCFEVARNCEGIVIFVSYKDIDVLAKISKRGYNIKIVNLTFTDIENGVKIRLMNNPERDHTESDIKSRIYWAKKDTKDYEKALQRYAETIVYTDVLGKEETYEKVCLDLGLRKK